MGFWGFGSTTNPLPKVHSAHEVDSTTWALSHLNNIEHRMKSSRPLIEDLLGDNLMFSSIAQPSAGSFYAYPHVPSSCKRHQVQPITASLFTCSETFHTTKPSCSRNKRKMSRNPLFTRTVGPTVIEIQEQRVQWVVSEERTENAY